MPLSDTAIRAAKPRDKQYKLADEKGLFLLVHPNGSRYWRMKYRYLDKEKTLALGVYPDVGLKDARSRRDDARKLLANGADPGETKKAQKATQEALASNSFETICREWLLNKRSNIEATNAAIKRKFGETLKFCKEVGFARIHVFPYSRREGTPAASSPARFSRIQAMDRAWALACSLEIFPLLSSSMVASSSCSNADMVLPVFGHGCETGRVYCTPMP